MFLLHSRTAFGLLLPAPFSLGESLVVSWQLRGCWEDSLPASWWSWRPGARVQLSSGERGPIPPLSRTSDSLERESCQVTCRGQHEPEASVSHLTQETGRVLSVWDSWTGGSYFMAWARVCASCCEQLAEAVLPTFTGTGAEERTPLLGPSPVSPFVRGPGTPSPPDGFASSDSLSGWYREMSLSVGSSSTWGPGATWASWPTAVLLADLEQDARQGECALLGAAPAGLAPLKPEASQSSSPGLTSCNGGEGSGRG